ncbi:type IV secretion system DNA-binding domain-containing protein [Tunturiibacter gelidoferens]|uniref:Type IV secretory pathway TraG/TraD family ATPase VirD4 n=1 Tax=Tunturiibacter lichenicola TaxID=2051959 RepID=A0A7Y9T4K9_9BACT|nr:type IV secretion system DNA-binding domain-containing protein [Edaphobacter lichenicola]NYF54118.1 type IV secretory pathway TraG/TraD family ATPase VirD4 [Edaphobacter lichenicola]
MAQQWGRKETVIWPPQVPIYTYGTLILALPIVLTLLASMYMMKPFLARNYTGSFIKSTAGSAFKMHNSYWLIYLGGGKRLPRVAVPADFVPGTMMLPDGKEIGVALSPAAKVQGYTTLFRGAARKFEDATFHLWLQSAIFGGDDLLGSYGPALIEASCVLVFMLCFAVPWDFKRGKQMKYGRLLRGPVMQTPKEFNKELRGAGLGLVTSDKGATIRLPLRAEPKHMWIMGDTGVGKSTLMKQLLEQIEDRGDSAIVYDPAAEFVQHFYREDRGDYILNPFDARSPYWTPSSELRNPAEARTIAESLYQPTNSKKGEFFTETPQKVFAHLMKYRPTPQELVEWMSNPAEIDRRVEGTEIAAMIAKDAPDQRNGVLGSLGLIADSLRLLKTKEQSNGQEWSATEWAEKREGWIFLTGTEEAHQNALRPLQSLWIDLLVLRLLAEPKPGQRRAWFVLDELATLQRLPLFHAALTKGRKSNNPIIFGFQGKAQLEETYGKITEVMLSMPTTKVIMKTSEPEAARWASDLIGEVEIERVRETKADGKRAGKSFTLDRQIEPLVMKSEIEGLEDLHAFMKLGNYVTRFPFRISQREKIAPAIVSRDIPEEDMWLRSLPPEPPTPEVATPEPEAPLAPAAASQPVPAAAAAEEATPAAGPHLVAPQAKVAQIPMFEKGLSQDAISGGM